MEDPRQPLVLRKWDEDTSFEFRGPDNPVACKYKEEIIEPLLLSYGDAHRNIRKVYYIQDKWIRNLIENKDKQLENFRANLELTTNARDEARFRIDDFNNLPWYLRVWYAFTKNI